ELQTIKELEALRADPQRYYETPPTKMISSSSAADEDIIPLVLARQEARAERFELPDLFKSKPGPKDQVRDLVYNNYSIESNFTKINNRGLHKGEVATMPWGGHYWPVYRGVIGQRYADNGFVDSSNTWFRGYQYIKQNSADAIY